MEARDAAVLTAQLQGLYADYCACLDERRFDEWPQFFTEDCLYKLIPRENFDRGLPLATLAFESRGMLEDRVYAVSQTLFHVPYYQRHILSSVRVRGTEGDVVRCEASYLVIRTRQNEPSELLNTGRYVDVVVRQDERLRFRERLCVFDSELIPNSIIYPI